MKKDFMKINDPLKTKIQTYAPVSGFLALGIVAISILIALITYNSHLAEYSIFNHFISELGHTIDSPFYFIFSLGLCLGSLLLILLFFGFGFHLDTIWARRAMRMGVFSCIACFLVGVFPGDTHKYAHLAVALAFFFGSLVTVALFALAIYKDESKQVPRWHIVPSAFMVVNSAVFLLLPTESVKQFLANREAFNRPDMWLNPFFEWMVLFSILLWMFFVSRHLYRHNKKEGIEMPNLKLRLRRSSGKND